MAGLTSKLPEVMEQRGMNQIGLAELSGIEQQTISAYCTGKRDPSLLDALQLAHCLKRRVEEIWSLDTEAEKETGMVVRGDYSASVDGVFEYC